MSMQTMAWAREAMMDLPTSMSATSRLLLLLLADHANEQGVCWPTVSHLADEVACTPRSVQRSIKALVEHGVLQVVPRKTEDGGQASNFYRLILCGNALQRQERTGGGA